MGWVMIALGGGLGSMARYGLSVAINDRYGPSPFGIFVVNITGAFLIGLLAGLAHDRIDLSPDARRFLTVGFLGGYTTFSTLMYDTVYLLENGEVVRAIANSLGSLVAGIAAVAVGLWLGRAL